MEIKQVCVPEKKKKSIASILYSTYNILCYTFTILKMVSYKRHNRQCEEFRMDVPAGFKLYS